MAHGPMAVFRKYEKTLLAVFGVLLMVGFLVGGVVSQSARRAADANNPNQVVVAMAGDELRESDLQNLRFARLHLRNFMQAVNLAAQQRGATPQRTLGIPNTVSEENLVQTSILAKQAANLGMAVSDEAVIDFLETYTQGTLNKGEFARLLQNATQNRMPQMQFFDAMRRELLALRYINLYQRGMLPPTPEAAWDYYERVNRRVTIEAVPFPAEDYLAKVSEPSEDQIKKLFEDGKERYPNPALAEPGFRRMKKVAVQYVKAEFAQFMDAAKATITDEQVQAYYDENKEVFRNISISDGAGMEATSPDGTLLPSDLNVGAPEGTSDATDGLNSVDAAADESTGISEAATGETPETQPLQDDAADDGPKVNDAPAGEELTEAVADEVAAPAEEPQDP
ncbi:MAG: SurA N-terminal domain-containing protein, partial [Planctomycetales bacterium]|nr:SurA N-terminal domain-containing protein [Planctomycetales bacterium]